MATELENQIQEFENLYHILCKDSNRFKKAIENTQLTPSQLKMLWGFNAYLKKDKKTCFEKLKSLKFHDSYFEGVKNCLLGLAHNHFGNYKFALEHLQMGQVLLRETSSSYFQVLNCSTLFMAYANRNEVSRLHELIDEIDEYKPTNDYARLLKVMCKAIYFQMAENYKKSEATIAAEFRKKTERFSVFEASFIVIRFVNSFKQKKFNQCERDLESYKNACGFTSTENYKFMKLLFEHAIKDKPLYVYKTDFEENAELYDQLMVIKSLAESDLEQAKKFWQKLAKHNQDIYAENFFYSGGACLFKSALEKYTLGSSGVQFDPGKLDNFAKIQDKISFLYEHGPETIKKDQLIMWLWNEEPSEKTRARLRKVIFDYNAKNGEAYCSYQNTYKKLKKAS